VKQFVICTGLFATALCASAANPVSWVASNGADNAACGTRQAPCRTFQGAIANTTPGGLVKAIDAADYSTPGLPLVISAPITIDGADVGAALVTSGVAVEVLATGTPGMVTIRNLTVNVAPGGEGIQVFRPATLENVTITGGAYGMSSGGGGVLTADHVTISGPSNVGVLIAGGKAVLRNSTVHGASLGVDLFHATALIDHSEISSNSTGVNVDSTSTLRISNSVVTGNNLGVARARGGQFFSFGNNVISGNAIDGDTPDPLPLK
jgi:hypothetical protein